MRRLEYGISFEEVRYMVKVEGIYKDLERIGQEILLDERGFELVLGNGKKEKFFERINEDIDFSLFLHHVEWVKRRALRSYSFINLCPSTLVKYAEDICNSITGKIVIEIREDYVEDKDFEVIVEIRRCCRFLLSLDDFGRKSSNLDRVLMLKPNFIKIDVSLFKNATELFSFTSFLERYARGIIMIAEKVETAEMLKKVRSAGIRFWQGWYEKQLYTSSILSLA